jgi:prepilin-type N-terminal cleavage/methylation domain-containing protein
VARFPHAPCLAPSRRAAGFTLAELTVVVAIMAIVSASALIRITRAGAFMAEGERIAHRLAADLRYTQSLAIQANHLHYLKFGSRVDGKFPSYSIYWKGDGDPAVDSVRTIPDCVAVTGADDKVEFNPGGDARKTYTFSITSPGHSYQITVVLATGAVILVEL